MASHAATLGWVLASRAYSRETHEETEGYDTLLATLEATFRGQENEQSWGDIAERTRVFLPSGSESEAMDDWVSGITVPIFAYTYFRPEERESRVVAEHMPPTWDFLERYLSKVRAIEAVQGVYARRAGTVVQLYVLLHNEHYEDAVMDALVDLELELEAETGDREQIEFYYVPVLHVPKETVVPADSTMLYDEGGADA